MTGSGRGIPQLQGILPDCPDRVGSYEIFPFEAEERATTRNNKTGKGAADTSYA